MADLHLIRPDAGSVTLAGLDRLEGLDVDWETEASSPPAEGPAAGRLLRRKRSALCALFGGRQGTSFRNGSLDFRALFVDTRPGRA